MWWTVFDCNSYYRQYLQCSLVWWRSTHCFPQHHLERPGTWREVDSRTDRQEMGQPAYKIQGNVCGIMWQCYFHTSIHFDRFTSDVLTVIIHNLKWLVSHCNVTVSVCCNDTHAHVVVIHKVTSVRQLVILKLRIYTCMQCPYACTWECHRVSPCP